MRSRIPEPMPTEKLLKYRWKTPLVLKDIVTRRVDPNTAAAPLQMYIGKTTHPYKFAAAQGRGLPALRPKGGKAWGYGLTPQDIRYPGPTLVATANVAPWTGGVWVQWTNLLPAGVAHPFVMPPSDARSGSMGGRYAPGHATVHLHGGHMPWTSDGHPVRRDGKASVLSPKSAHGTPHSVLFEYPNTQRGGATLWYHDHTMDATATNVYAGLAGGYLLRDPAEDACAALPTGDFEVPLIIQDRSFDVHGVQLYGDARYLAARVAAQRRGRVAGRQVAPPVPEFKGAALCVNGKVWPTLAVEPRAYRFRVLNGCNSRMLVMRLSPADPSAPDEPDTVIPDPGLAMWQIGADGGLFSAAVELKGDLSGGPSTAQLLVLAPGERADILVDFSAVAGRTFYLSNHALDTSPFGNGGDVASSADGSNAILQLVVANSAPQALDLPAVDAGLATLGQWAGFGQGHGIVRRYVVKEFFTALTPDDAVSLVQPPPGRPGWNAITLQPDLALFDKPGDLWAGKAPDNSTPLTPAFGPLPAGGPALGTDDLPASPNRHQLGNQVELWEIYNISVDVHPIHLHLASFQVLSRQEILNSDPAQLGATLAVDANEQGWKDTVRANPDQVTRLLVRFDDGGDGTRDYTGHFVWHCHLIEHEDMGMMRPLEIY